MDHLIADIPQKALIENEGKILLVQDAGGTWELPGGRLAIGEAPVDGLKREVKEELGADIEPVRIFDTAVFTGSTGGSHYVVMYLCKLTSNTAELKVDGVETIDMKWIDKNELADLPIGKEYTRAALHKFFTQQNF